MKDFFYYLSADEKLDYLWDRWCMEHGFPMKVTGNQFVGVPHSMTPRSDAVPIEKASKLMDRSIVWIAENMLCWRGGEGQLYLHPITVVEAVREIQTKKLRKVARSKVATG